MFASTLGLTLCSKDNGSELNYKPQKLDFSQKLFPMSHLGTLIDNIFAFPAPAAILSCDEIELKGNAVVDGFNSFCGDYPSALTSVFVVYIKEAKIKGNAKVYGQIVKGEPCNISRQEFNNLFSYTKSNNDNSNIPPEFVKDGELKLKNKIILELPGGVYYFKEVELSGHSILKIKGKTLILVEEEIKITGSASVEGKDYNLRLITLGEVKVEGNAKFNGYIIAPFSDVRIKGNSQIFGAIISNEFVSEGNASLHFDKVLSLNSVVVYPQQITIKVGEQFQLAAKALDIMEQEIECTTFEWSSENTSVAIVSDGGLVTGVEIGETFITVSVLWLAGKSKLTVISVTPFWWAKTFGGVGEDYAYSIHWSNDNSYIVVGDTNSFGVGDYDFWAIEIDKVGSIQWQKTFGGNNHDFAHSILQTPDNGYIVAGLTWSFGAGSGDFWVIKLDNLGNIKWQKTYGGIGEDTAFQLQEVPDEGYIIAGYTNSFGVGGYDFWLLRVDKDGNIVFNPLSGAHTTTTYAIPLNANCVSIDTSANFVGETNADVADTFIIPMETSALTTTQAP